MDFAAVIVFILALLFFGGIGYLSWNARQKLKLDIHNQASSAAESEPQTPKGKEQKRRPQ